MSDNNINNIEDNEVNDKKTDEKLKHKSKKMNFVFIFMLIILFLYPILDYTSLFRTNHVLDVRFIFDENSDDVSEPDDVVHCLYNGGILRLSIENCEKAYVILHHDLGVHKYGLRDNGSFRHYDVMLNFIGDYGWKLQQVTQNHYYFVKSKLRFLPSSF